MAALWGSTLVVMKGIYAHMSPENLLACRFAMAAAAVSYTHLTLPTILLV